MLAFMPFVRRVFRGVAGAGWGLSLGFRLLNLWGPYEASLLGRAADAVDETEALARRWASYEIALEGSRDLERSVDEAVGEVASGERSKRSASAFTLFDWFGGERVVEAEAGEAVAEAVVFLAALALECRGRAVGMSRLCCGEAGAWSSVEVEV